MYIPFSFFGAGYIESTGGDVIGYYGEGDTYYKYHLFTSTGASSLDVQFGEIESASVLVVAGGGGGSGNAQVGGKAGGGAGGLILKNDITLSTGTYNIVVGDRGGDYTNGQNSSFVSTDVNLVAIGGGRGGRRIEGQYEGANGGSGGGAVSPGGTTVNGGSGTPTQGNDGGSAVAYGYGGGGGGYGSDGGSAGPFSGGTGGAGVLVNLTGESLGYSRGGAGNGATGTTGRANSGNGGNGSGTFTGGNQGVVIVRYLFPQGPNKINLLKANYAYNVCVSGSLNTYYMLPDTSLTPGNTIYETNRVPGDTIEDYKWYSDGVNIFQTTNGVIPPVNEWYSCDNPPPLPTITTGSVIDVFVENTGSYYNTQFVSNSLDNIQNTGVTLEIWARDIEIVINYEGLIGLWDGQSTPDRDWIEIRKEQTGGNIILGDMYSEDSPTFEYKTSPSSPVPNSNNWYHHVVTYNPNNQVLKYYRNGILEGSVATSGLDNTIDYTTVYVGRKVGGTSSNMYVGEYRVYTSSLDDSQVRSNYDASYPRYETLYGTGVEWRLTAPSGGGGTYSYYNSMGDFVQGTNFGTVTICVKTGTTPTFGSGTVTNLGTTCTQQRSNT